MLKDAAIKRAAIAVAIFIIWTAITAFSSRLWSSTHGPEPIAESVAGSIQPSLGLALLFLIVVQLILRWPGVGLNRPHPGAVRLIWFPAIYIVGFVGLIGLVGLPPLKTTMILLGNMMLVGVSEEFAARGILYRGLRDKLALWPAALLSSLLFGAVHLVNGFTTGDFKSAGIQSVTAFMTGMAFLGIRVRTGSLYPGMILHGLWDFALIVAVTGGGAAKAVGDPSILSGWQLLLPVAFILPNFICGIMLLRGARERDLLPI